MTALARDDRARLKSRPAGERYAAELAAMRFLRQCNDVWVDGVLRPTNPEPWRETVGASLPQRESLRCWGAGFRRDIADFTRSGRMQRYAQTDTAARVLREAAA